MTNEQLDEIEKLAVDFKSAAFHDLMARQTLPLVKALREARAALDQVSSDDRMSEAQITAAITEAQKERDEARSEVERLKAERDEAWDRVDNLEGVIRDNIPYSYDQGEPDEDEATPEECVEYAAKEIADLKAEVERLREAAIQIRMGLIGMLLSDGLDAIDQKRRELFEITKGMVE